MLNRIIPLISSAVPREARIMAQTNAIRMSTAFTSPVFRSFSSDTNFPSEYDERSKAHRTLSEEDLMGRKVYVGNLPYTTTWMTLKDHMAQAGTVLRADVLEKNGRPTGRGIVTFLTKQDADNAMEELENTEVDGRSIFVKPYTRGNTQTTHFNAKTRVFVTNLPYTATWQDVKDHFGQVAEVKYAGVFKKDNGYSKGHALVQFATEEGANLAVETLNETEFQGRNLLVRPDRVPESGSIDETVGNNDNSHRDEANEEEHFEKEH